MDLAGPLREDHSLIRKKLALLESTLEVAPETRFVLREMCYSMHRLLYEHMQREESALRLYYSRPVSAGALPRAQDHSEEHALFRGVTELMHSGVCASIPLIVQHLCRAVDELRTRMEEQERKLFAFLHEQTEGHPAGRFETAISQTMSVNEIVQRYPKAGSVFERLQVNRWREGYESLDEVAWHRGLNASEILEQLHDAVFE